VIKQSVMENKFPIVAKFIHRSRVDFLLVLPFILFLFLQLAHHQMWRDETNPWALAVNSRTPGELIYFARNEAHPFLWYLILWIVSRGTSSLIALKCVAAFVGACSYLVIALWSPFSRLEKILLFCCYYISFEYAVFARMYGVMLLLVLLYVRSRTLHPNKLVLNALWLGMIANADTYGVLLTFALVLEYTLFLRDAGYSQKPQWRKQKLVACGVYLVFLGLSFASLIPTRHVSVKNRNGAVLAHVHDPIYFMRAVREAALDTWYPVDSDAPGYYWNVIHSRRVTDAFLALVLIAAALQFRREKRLLWMLAFYGLVLILFMDLVYMGASRHYGTMFVAFVAALWIQRSQELEAPTSLSTSPRFALVPAPFALAPLGACTVAGIMAAYASWTHPFSQAGATARWLEANHYDRAPIAGTPDYSAANVAAHLGRSIYFLECECTDTFMQFSDRRDNFADNEIPARLAQAFALAHQPFLIYLGVRPLTQDEMHALGRRDLMALPLAQFTGAEEREENFFLYKVQTVGPGYSVQ
jgi:hypothetical protein